MEPWLVGGLEHEWIMTIHMLLTGAKRREWMGCWGLLG